MNPLTFFMDIIGRDDDDKDLEVTKTEVEVIEDGRPYLIANLGLPEGWRQLFYPSKDYVNSELEYTAFVTMLKTDEKIPVQVGKEFWLVGWKEMRLFFDQLVDKFLLEHYNIFASDSVGKKNDEEEREV